MLTPNSALSLAFDPSLIPSQLQATLPSGIHLRPLSSTDHSRSHLAVLTVLTPTPDPGPEAWLARFEEMVATKGTYYPIVLVEEESDQIVAVGTVLLERKFIRNMGIAGHIEDIAVSTRMQGKGLGKRIIEVLTALSEELGAYKVRLSERALGGSGADACSQTILDCSPTNEGELCCLPELMGPLTIFM